MEDEPRDTCFGAGNVAGAVIGTFLTTILLLLIAALLYRQWRRHKGKSWHFSINIKIISTAGNSLSARFVMIIIYIHAFTYIYSSAKFTLSWNYCNIILTITNFLIFNNVLSLNFIIEDNNLSYYRFAVVLLLQQAYVNSMEFVAQCIGIYSYTLLLCNFFGNTSNAWCKKLRLSIRNNRQLYVYFLIDWKLNNVNN